MQGEYEIVDTNAGNICDCGFCGYRAGRSEGHRRKAVADGVLAGAVHPSR